MPWKERWEVDMTEVNVSEVNGIIFTMMVMVNEVEWNIEAIKDVSGTVADGWTDDWNRELRVVALVRRGQPVCGPIRFTLGLICIFCIPRRCPFKPLKTI